MEIIILVEIHILQMHEEKKIMEIEKLKSWKGVKSGLLKQNKKRCLIYVKLEFRN